jgi:hypothetical protein
MEFQRVISRVLLVLSCVYTSHTLASEKDAAFLLRENWCEQSAKLLVSDVRTTMKILEPFHARVTLDLQDKTIRREDVTEAVLEKQNFLRELLADIYEERFSELDLKDPVTRQAWKIGFREIAPGSVVRVSFEAGALVHLGEAPPSDLRLQRLLRKDCERAVGNALRR